MVKVTRWTARIISALIVALILLFFFSHLIGGLIYPDEGFKFKTLRTITIVGFVFIGITTIGLLASWKYELQGGVVAMAGYLSFAFLTLLDRDGGPTLIRTWPFFVCFLCGAMFVSCWYADRRRSLTEKT